MISLFSIHFFIRFNFKRTYLVMASVVTLVTATLPVLVYMGKLQELLDIRKYPVFKC